MVDDDDDDDVSCLMSVGVIGKYAPHPSRKNCLPHDNSLTHGGSEKSRERERDDTPKGRAHHHGPRRSAR